MTSTTATIAETYYKTLAKKDVTDLEKYLHPDVQFIGPLAKTIGKAGVLEATKKFASAFKALTIRSKFGSENQAVIIYDIEFPAPIGMISSSALMTIKDGLVVKIELFYDARPFEPKK